MKKTLKNLLKLLLFIIICPIIFFSYDLIDFDKSYLNRSAISFDIKNQNSRHTMHFTNNLRYYYLKITKIINPIYYKQRWEGESIETRALEYETKNKKITPVDYNKPIYNLNDYNIENNWFKSHGNNFSTRFSNLKKINIKNANNLALAWKYTTPVISEKFIMNVQANPVFFKGLVISPNPENQIVALDGSNGKVKWSFKIDDGIAAKRGLIIFDPKTLNKKKYKNSNPWLFFTNNRHQLFALDITNGKPIKSFGRNGVIKTGLTPMPPIIYKNNLVIMDTKSIIECYDIEDGKLKWKYRVNKTKNSIIFQNFNKGSPWGGLSIDEKRGLLFFNTGNPEQDHIGIDRPGPNLYANSVVAFDINKKEIKWYFQEISHDLWNMDIAATPILSMIKKNDQLIDVVISISKTGNVIVLDRSNGKSLFDYKKIKAPMSDVPGERTSPYQITFPNNDKVCRNNFKEEYLSNLPYVNRKELKERVKDLHFGFPSPPMLKKEMLHLEGCARWSGGSVDTHKNILYLNIDQEPVIVSISKSRYWKGQYAYNVKPFRDKLQFPAIKPPWGAIVAFDLKNGKTLWKVPFGEWEKLKKINIPKTGTKNRAGITASSGGVIFASGTWDDKFIVVNSSNGKTLWEFKMSAPGSAPPTTYLINEKQYVLVPAFEKRGRSIYAFSLN